MNTRLQYWTRTIRIGLKSNTYNTKMPHHICNGAFYIYRQMIIASGM